MAFSLDQFRLDGQTAIVTGVGARGNSIGRAFAHGLAAAGANVVVASRSDATVAVVEEIVATGGRALPAKVDITDPDSVRAMVAKAVSEFGGLDIIVNNAALMAELDFKPAIATSIEDWNRIMAVNVTGALNCAQAAAPQMRQRGGGRIVNILSSGAFPAASVYGVSKLALLGLTTTLAKELGRDGIAVNAIAPGMTASEAGLALTPPDSPYVKIAEAKAALRAFGEPDELVGALLLLCSAAGRWMTGQVLNVDGGIVLRP
ncbi:NAD(P)-dependent dehydrogenase (short-subunit alcohol dehydrogenase family) [Novosphingobium hassiacum]|uniref:NAD(P)-dependent dehydrogenase (Short-subunit alcohol dehydrogenase family) n=1 Tax=Novosphingobium hassiacum TaxID=173676 RepID=A0A7W6EW12_9SPHN|nr:SDR family oxidoreductase [Novosphingobium hassiacum]MBB3860912.1 NAD(P)-dependent dehydrogenase (short-subunit alcohol dehydrogenase family) [Novosphingobium hassiacum]